MKGGERVRRGFLVSRSRASPFSYIIIGALHERLFGLV